MLIALNKPYGVLSQFTGDGSPNRTLYEFDLPPDVYAIGRLDADSEGLLLLSDERDLPDKILPPHRAHPRSYLVQVEGIPEPSALKEMSAGVRIADYTTLPCTVVLLDPQPEIAPRVPPIRVRKTVPDCWIRIELKEGKNRQVRKMTAAVGYPTLRLVRIAIGNYEMKDIAEGTWKELDGRERQQVLGITPKKGR